jgi:hypothetical protein
LLQAQLFEQFLELGHKTPTPIASMRWAHRGENLTAAVALAFKMDRS